MRNLIPVSFPSDGIALMTAMTAMFMSSPANAATVPSAFVGTWTLVAADVRHPDGSLGRDYGDAPAGQMHIEKDGRYSLQIYKTERPKFASNDKAKGTPEEYRETVMGFSIHYGQFGVKGDKLEFSIEQASFSNWNGTTQQRTYKLKGDELSYTVPARPNGDVPVSIWRKLR